MATDAGTDELSDTAGGEHNRLKSLGKYRIERRIGAGGMGTVFLAVDDSLNRTVALKVLPKDRAENPVLVRRFKAEGQAAAHLEHPNIVRVFEAGEADGFLYMALEYVEGVDVHELVERRGIIPVKRSTDIIRQTALALQHAFEKGIVHRDIKPSNLLIRRDGTVKLADMGLARSVDDTLETNITRAGTTVGTVDYMSPEQARNSKAADVRSDIYSLGCTWYHMLTGHPPFPDGSMTNKLQAHAVSARPDPRAENDRVPEGVVAIIQRMMACKPDDRYQTPEELLQDLASAGKMHRAVDESVLAALANDADDIEAETDRPEPVLRMRDDDEAFDLSALKESGEYDAAPTTAKRSPIPPKPNAATPGRGVTRRSEEADVEESADDSIGRSSSSRGSSHPSDRAPGRSRRTSAPAAPPSDAGDPQGRRRRTASTVGAEEPAGGTADRSRQSKRGSVRTSGGAAPSLPGKEAPVVVDGATRQGINLEALKFIVPAVLAVAALVAIGFAILRSGDAIDFSGGANPYADGRPETKGPLNEAPADVTPEPEAIVAIAPDPPPTVEVLPFPGAEGVTPSSDQKPLIPDWVAAFRQPVSAAERLLVVRRRPGGSNEVGTIAEAVRRLPGGGGTIEIDGDGPFRLESLDVQNLPRVSLVAAEGRRPVIQLRPPADWNGEPLLRIRGARVDLQGLHFVLVDAGPAGATLFDVVDGNLSLRDCSITVVQEAPVNMTALRIDGRGGVRRGVPANGRCLLENVVIRGPQLTAIALTGPAGDLVAGNCLFASGNAPTMTIADTGQVTGGLGADPPVRGIRLLATTIVSEASGFEFVHQPEEGDVTPTEVFMRQSLVLRTSGAAAADSVAMSVFRGWPGGSGTIGESRLRGMTWQTEQSPFVGWSNLLSQSNADGTPLIAATASADEWRKIWNQGLRSDAVLAQPIDSGPSSDIEPADLHRLVATSFPSLGTDNLPGCRPDELTPLPSGLMTHVVEAMRQPGEPEWLGAGLPVKGDPVRFDLSLRRSLTHFLASDACPDGSHVIAFGTGLKELEQVVIEGKSLRLEFESTGKTPLTLQPKPGREGAPADEALIRVTGGTLDLVNASIKLPASRTTVYPRSAILLEDASLSVRNSRIEGPRLESREVAPLIRWNHAEGSVGDRALLVENSFLVSLTTLMSGPVLRQSLVVRNAVLVSGEDALVVSVDSADHLPTAIVLDHCTVAANGAAIRVDSEGVAAASGVASLFARACVFAGPIDMDAAQSAVVAHSTGALDDHLLTWWGSANGYSRRLAGVRHEPPAPPASFESDWLTAWGEGHEANPLSGAADVLFSSDLPNLQTIEPGNVALAAAATAVTWGPLGESIGAVLDAIGPIQAAATPAPPKSGTPSPIPSATPGRKNPGF